MVKLAKLLSILFVISLLALPLACTCSEWGGNLIMTVDTPQDGTTVTTSPVTVSGTLTKSATVKINDVVVPVKDNKFSTTVTLTEGKNVIDIVAKSVDPSQTVTKTVTVIYTLAK